MGLSISSHKITYDPNMKFFDIPTTNIAGVDQTCGYYKDNFPHNPPGLKAIIVTNVAGKCGLTTKHYKQFVEIYSKYREQGLEIMAFPCGQFNNQEFNTPKEIVDFAASHNATFPIFSKIDVNGSKSSPVFQYCKYHADDFGGAEGKLKAIGWNFGKFLLDSEGFVVKYYGPKTYPNDMISDIELVLKGELKGKFRKAR